jgi:hypothetical protein
MSNKRSIPARTNNASPRRPAKREKNSQGTDPSQASPSHSGSSVRSQSVSASPMDTDTDQSLFSFLPGVTNLHPTSEALHGIRRQINAFDQTIDRLARVLPPASPSNDQERNVTREIGLAQISATQVAKERLIVVLQLSNRPAEYQEGMKALLNHLKDYWNGEYMPASYWERVSAMVTPPRDPLGRHRGRW